MHSTITTLNRSFSSSWNLSKETAYDSIKKITKILAEFAWVYNTRNTEIFVHNVLEKIPSEWVDAIIPLSVLEVKQLPFGFIKENWPTSLKEFIVESTQLAKLRFPECADYCEEISSLQLVEKNMPLKKQNEIAAMSSLIYKICKDVGCCNVLDIGSGLGYLDQFLHHNFGLQCVGLDSVKKITDGAKNRLKKDPCSDAMQHETLFIKNNEECIEKLQVILKNSCNINPTCAHRSLHFPNVPSDSGIKHETSSFVMVGLHCCGNLMQDMMKLFYQMDELKAFVCMGCCYNKINLDDFPMSQSALNAINSAQDFYPEWHPCTSGLRLGSHATRADLNSVTPDVLHNREWSLIYRAILEYYISSENINWRKPKRRVRTSDLENFEKYCDNMFHNNEDISCDFEKNERMTKLRDIYSSKQMLFPRVRVLLVLQVLLQPLWESFVILDRLFFFKEKSIFADVYSVLDDSISPRNIALYVYKS